MQCNNRNFPSPPSVRMYNSRHGVFHAASTVVSISLQRHPPRFIEDQNSQYSVSQHNDESQSRSSEDSDRPYPNWMSNLLLRNNHVSHSLPPVTPPPTSRSQDLLSPPDTHRVASLSEPFKHGPFQNSYPVQSRYHSMPRSKCGLPPQIGPQHSIVGDPKLKIHRLRLPPHLIHLLDTIVMGCESHAATLGKGWLTELYSLTKQDIALREIPHLYHAVKPIVTYVKRAIAHMYGYHTLKLDRNQPHVLKYSTEGGCNHTGVELHHDKCDVTANLCMSRSTSYVGGGTYFPDARQVVRLEFGEFILHPGPLVHGGMNISSGNRYLMVIFANAVN